MTRNIKYEQSKTVVQLYAIMTDSPHIFDRRVFARKAPEFCGPKNWWTEKANKTLWLLPLEMARAVCADYRYNNPRIVKEKRAVEILSKQNELRDQT